MDKDVEAALKREQGDYLLAPPYQLIVAGLCLFWALFQLWIASPLPFTTGLGMPTGISARGVHLGFAFAICFISFAPVLRGGALRPSVFSLVLGAVSVSAALYVYVNYDAISARAGLQPKADFLGFSVPYEAVIGWLGLLMLLEATRRTVGLPLAIVAFVFLIYSWLGPYMPDLISHKGVSLTGLSSYQWMTDQGVFGIPIDVAVRFIFLFVVFGALLDRAGAGQFFMDLALALVGRYRGGPAKAAVLASGMTGMVSGSSIANTVTTGTFTIPLMKRTGLSSEQAGAIEVAASVNGQIMPPIMGAAAFVMAELLAISYFDVITHAFVPAVISYIALFYIADVEADKLGLKPAAEARGPRVLELLRRDGYYLLPLVVLVYLLIGERMTTGAAVFWSILFLMGLLVVREIARAGFDLRRGGVSALLLIGAGLVQGAKNMVSVAIALAAAGIIVGAVGQSGLSNALTGIVETLAMGNLYLLLLLVALLSLILGMGLPTTANYLVVATLMVPVIAKVGASVGFEVPLIAAHLFVFYFGLMADVTPPVALSAYAAAAISKGDPLKTGFRAFFYSIRTAILPFVFIFNLDLLLLGITSFWEAALIFVASLAAILAFTSLTFRWLMGPLSYLQMVLLALACALLLRPDFFVNQVAVPYLEVPVKALQSGVVAERLRLKIKGVATQRETWVSVDPMFASDKSHKIDFKTLGISARPVRDGAFAINTLKFDGAGKKAGINFGDMIVAVQKPNPARLSPKLLYIPGLLLLGLLVFMQRRGRAKNVAC